MPSQGKRKVATLEPSAAKRPRRQLRSSSTTTPADEHDGSVFFKEVWRLLRSQGWTSKPPPLRGGLDTEHRYIRPGCSTSGQEGTDYFVGAQALVEHYKATEKDRRIVMDGDTIMVRTIGSAVESHHDVPSEEETASSGSTTQTNYRDSQCNPVSQSQEGTEAVPQSAGERLNANDSSASISDERASQLGNEPFSVGDSSDNESIISIPSSSDDASGSDWELDGKDKRCPDGNTPDHASLAERRGGSGAARGGGSGAARGGGNGAAREDGRGGGSGAAHGDGRGGGSGATRGDGGGREGGTASSARSERGDVTAGSARSGRGGGAAGGASRGRGSGVGRALNAPVGERNAGDQDERGDDFDFSDTAEIVLNSGSDENGVADPDNSAPVQALDTSELYMNSLVAFSPAKEKWLLTTKLAPLFRQVGTAYVYGRVCQRVKKARKELLYEVRWLDSMFNKSVELSIGVIQRGIESYRLLQRTASKPSWTELTAAPAGGDLPEDAVIEDLEELEGLDRLRFDPDEPLPTSLMEVEAVKSMCFDPRVQMRAPEDLFKHRDGATTTRVRPESVYQFTHSASSSFLAYIPIYFWNQVVNESNAYAVVKGVPLTPPITLTELMTFIGILFFMAINDKGEYANYWGVQPEDAIVRNHQSSGLERVMTLRRFKLIRKLFCFRASPSGYRRDPAARIRPLLNLLKRTGGSYIELGRDLALDECSVACRSKFGRHVIMFNPMKPTGKYHFRLYTLCCATTWIALNFRFHCSSNIMDRLDDVADVHEVARLQAEMADAKVSTVRRLVLEVARPVYGSNRILNMDNYYTSVQLLQALRLKGLYARGTVRGSSRHFPKHTVLDPKTASRGDYRQGVSRENNIVAASWWDGSMVQMVSNADASTITTVSRQVDKTAQAYPAPTCVKAYNQYMQGVDRFDQIRGRFSIADGHSYKKWHKKLALALIDFARVNAFLTRRMVVDTSKDRDPHRTFMIELASELISGKWTDAPGDCRMVFSGSVGASSRAEAAVRGQHNATCAPDTSPKDCIAVASEQALKGCNRKRRGCVVCRWENRYPTERTDYCGNHNVCLCRAVYPGEVMPFMCIDTNLTCWQKFHEFYFPKGLFSAKGNIRKLSGLYKAKHAQNTQVETGLDTGNEASEARVSFAADADQVGSDGE